MIHRAVFNMVTAEDGVEGSATEQASRAWTRLGEEEEDARNEEAV